jgi:hypothetical protein
VLRNADLTVALGMSREKNDLILFVALCILECAMAIILIGLYIKGERSFANFVLSKPGIVLVCGLAAFLIGGAVITHQYLTIKRLSLHRFWLVVAMNIVTVVLVLFTSETALRILSRTSIEGENLGSYTLIPKSWDALTAHNRNLLMEAGARPTFHIYDALLGWTIGPNRRSANGLYYSSLEGVRAPHQGMSFAKASKKRRVALVGDSYTFGEDVAYAETWGHLLEKALGPEYEVLNFGVPGYGVDQAYLRFEKDVTKWKPDVVILSFIAHDVERTMTVYTTLNYPTWDMPFSKPRFILRDGALKQLNIPPLEPKAIFARPSVSELPFIEYDRGYRKRDWQQSLIHRSYIARVFMTWLPRWEAVSADVSDDGVVAVNAAILNAFVRSVEGSGAAPLVVYHPKREGQPTRNSSLGRRVLNEAGVPYTEPTSCLREVDPTEWFIPQGHYTPKGNAAVAKCLVHVVRQALDRSSPG